MKTVDLFSTTLSPNYPFPPFFYKVRIPQVFLYSTVNLTNKGELFLSPYLKRLTLLKGPRANVLVTPSHNMENNEEYSMAFIE